MNTQIEKPTADELAIDPERYELLDALFHDLLCLPRSERRLATVHGRLLCDGQDTAARSAMAEAQASVQT